MRQFLYKYVFISVIRPLLHWFGVDFVAWSNVVDERDVWRCVMRYSDVAVNYDEDLDSTIDRTNIIWQFWWQGVDSAPEIVKKCMESVRKHSGGWSVVVIDKDNINSYIDIPEVIKSCFDAGRMSLAHFSDYLRARLLSTHGGIWADATVYLTDDIPDDILAARFFMFKSSGWVVQDFIPNMALLQKYVYVAGRNILGGGDSAGSSWFLAARKGSPIMSLTAKLIEQYWIENDALIDYYLFHKFVTLSVCFNSSCREEYCSAPPHTNIYPHILQYSMFDPENSDLWLAIRKVSAIHKLTYKHSGLPTFVQL